MKKEIIYFIFTICLMLTACDSASTVTKKLPENAAGINMNYAFPQTWDVFNIMFPEDFDFYGGTTDDQYDIRYFTLKRDDTSYYMFYAEDSKKPITEQFEKDRDSFSTNQINIEGKYGQINWKGFEYTNDQDKQCFEMYAKSNGKHILVRGVGFSFDAPETVGILGALKLDEESMK